MHPIWTLEEATATVLSMLVEEDSTRICIISDLLSDKHWRVQFGASAAAFYVRHVDNYELFFKTATMFHTHKNCWVRGMVAENLAVLILNSSNVKRDELLQQFKKEIQFWLSNEEDCWVFEPLFRLFNTLHKRGVDMAWLFPARITRLLQGMPQWYKLDREEFQRGIESRKEELVQGNFLVRFTRNALKPARSRM